jgi:hypothetical protein
MIRVLRLMEYIYPDNETAQDDMGRWGMPAIGNKELGVGKSIRSTILTDLSFTPSDVVGGEIVLGRCIHGVDLDKTFCEHGC